MKTIGLDIGTTTICGVLMDGSKVLRMIRAKNSYGLPPSEQLPCERLQDAEGIVEVVKRLYEDLYEPDVEAVGLSGQMHGIVYVDENGGSVSPVYTWQDGRGDLPCSGGLSYAEILSHDKKTRLSTGFGEVTHFFNTLNGFVPASAVSFCAIADLCAMALTGRKKPLTHISHLASFGGALSEFSPEMTKTAAIVGETAQCVPVICSIGDNQASYICALGSGGEGSVVLLNLGTGGQISYATKPYRAADDYPAGVELRPLDGDKFIAVGSSICGGRALAIWEGFLRDVVKLAVPGYTGNLFEAIDKAALTGGGDIKFDTRFSGSRIMPGARGAISGLSEDNFTPQAVSAALFRGIAEELYGLWDCESENTLLIGSGNAMRRNPAMRAAAEWVFGMPLILSPYEEESAAGAAIYAQNSGII